MSVRWTERRRRRCDCRRRAPPRRHGPHPVSAASQALASYQARIFNLPIATHWKPREPRTDFRYPTRSTIVFSQPTPSSRTRPPVSPFRQLWIPHTSRRRSSAALADTRESPQRRVGETCSRVKSPLIPAQPASAMTGLSRRRSRVRVPAASHTRRGAAFVDTIRTQR